MRKEFDDRFDLALQAFRKILGSAGYVIITIDPHDDGGMHTGSNYDEPTEILRVALNTMSDKSNRLSRKVVETGEGQSN